MLILSPRFREPCALVSPSSNQIIFLKWGHVPIHAQWWRCLGLRRYSLGFLCCWAYAFCATGLELIRLVNNLCILITVLAYAWQLSCLWMNKTFAERAVGVLICSSWFRFSERKLSEVIWVGKLAGSQKLLGVKSFVGWFDYSSFADYR